MKKKEDALQEEQPPDEDGDEEEYVETDLIRVRFASCLFLFVFFALAAAEARLFDLGGV